MKNNAARVENSISLIFLREIAWGMTKTFLFFLTLTFIAINYYLETINNVSTTVNTTYGAYGTILHYLHHTIYRVVTIILVTCFNT